MVLSDFSPFGDSVALSGKSFSAKSEGVKGGNKGGRMLADLVVSFWKAVHCGDLVLASDVVDESGNAKNEQRR